MMGNLQNISVTKSISKYIQFGTIFSSLAQFVDKSQGKKCNPQRFSEENSDFVKKLRIFHLFHVGYFFKTQFVSLKQTKSV